MLPFGLCVFSLTSALQVFDSLKYIDRGVWSSNQYAFEKKRLQLAIQAAGKGYCFFCSTIEKWSKTTQFHAQPSSTVSLASP